MQKNLQVQVRDGGNWKTVAEAQGRDDQDRNPAVCQPVTTDGLRILVPATDLPQSDNAQVDGIVRICELLAISPEGTEGPLIEVVRDN